MEKSNFHESLNERKVNCFQCVFVETLSCYFPKGLMISDKKPAATNRMTHINHWFCVHLEFLLFTFALRKNWKRVHFFHHSFHALTFVVDEMANDSDSFLLNSLRICRFCRELDSDEHMFFCRLGQK